MVLVCIEQYVMAIESLIKRKLTQLGADKNAQRVNIAKNILQPYLQDVPLVAYEIICLSEDGVCTIRLKQNGFAQLIRYKVFECLEKQLPQLTQVKFIG